MEHQARLAGSIGTQDKQQFAVIQLQRERLAVLGWNFEVDFHGADQR